MRYCRFVKMETNMNTEEFKNEYSLGKLQIVTPKRRNFEMAVSPKYIDHYIQNAYENFTADLLLNLSKDNTIFIDIGAHFGFYTLLIGSKRKNNKIVAFEPVPENFDILKKNIELNDIKNVDVYNLAVSNKCETTKFNVAEHSCSSGFYHHPLSETVKTIDVEALTIDDFLRGSDISHDLPVIIKIDTEGHDLIVLEGMKETLKSIEDVKLFIELNPKCLKSAGYQPEDLLEKVSQLGFDIYVIEDEYRETYKLTDIKKWNDYFGKGNYGRTYFNILCIKKQKSLSVCIFSHSSQLAGAERSLLELTTELIRDQGAICSVILPSDGPLKDMLEDVGVSTLVMDYSWWCDSNCLSDEDINLRLNNSYKILVDRIQKIRKINPDIILTNTMVIPWGCLAAAIIGKPHVSFVREFGKLDHNLKFYIPLYRILDFIKDSSNLILTNSDAVKRELFGNSEEILTVYPYIDIPNVCRSKSVYFMRECATKLIIVGNIHESKGQEDAILAIKELVKRKKDVELVILGTTSSSEYLKELKEIVRYENLEEFVRFLDFREDPYSVIDQTDIVLVCSRHEAMGRVTLESMLLKKAVIGANSGGTSELIKEGFDGLLYEPRNYKQLADKIEYLIDNKEKIKEFGENGYQSVRNNFTKEKYGEKVYKLLMDLKDSPNPLASSKFMIELITNLSSMKESKISELNNLLRTKESQISELNSSLDTKESQISELNSSLDTKESQISELNSSLDTKESKISELNSSLDTKESQISELNSSLDTKESQISELNSSLDTKESQISELSNSLQAIQKSMVWRSVMFFHKSVIERLLPHSTNRRGIYDILLKSGRIVSNEGFGSLWWHYKERKRVRASEKRLSENIKDIQKLHIDTHPKNWNDEKIIFPILLENPDVSIIIPVYNNSKYTFHCLDSILKNTKGSFEVIVIDDASSDDTSNLLTNVKNISIIRNNENQGFVESCNIGAKSSKGKYLFFLNNDTVVTENWLEPLKSAISDNSIGIVGAKLIYPDGKLQEAGGIIWNDASGWNYGRYDDPNRPEYNFIREVDYCSGAALLVKKELFERLDGFDVRFKPGYYEDTDLCFSVRKLGYKVLYQPQSVIVHFEGITGGTDVNTGAKKYQEINKSKFYAKWKDVLEKENHKPDAANLLFYARDKRKGKNILIIDHYVPTFDKDSGSYRMYNILKILSELGHKVTFIGDNLMPLEPYTGLLQQYGVEVIYAPYIKSINDYLVEKGKFFDVAIISRSHIAKNHISTVRRYCSKAKIIFDTVDLQYLREMRRATVENNENVLKDAQATKVMELKLAKEFDVTLVVSPVEKDIILKEDPSLKIEILSNIHEIYPPKKVFSEREGIMFLGGFDHLPNMDAVKYFVKEILPIIKKEIPSIKFYIVGSNPPREIEKLSSEHVIVTGYVKDLTPYFENCRIFVAPLRYGAGVKGKIGESMAHGLPVVTTSIGSEGMNLTHEENVFVSDRPDEFAKYVLTMYKDEVIWNKISKNSIDQIRKMLSYEVGKSRLKLLISNILSKNEHDSRKIDSQADFKSRNIKAGHGRQHFIDKLSNIKKGSEDITFYPYSTMSNLDHLDNLLNDINLSAEDILVCKTVNDIGGADGDMAFYCEYLGAEKVNLIDNPPTNFNGLKGAMKVKDSLKSKVNIVNIDLDDINGWGKIEKVDITIFLGILYHLKNPFLALSQLSKISRYLIISTKVFDDLNGYNVASSSVAYFYDQGECNNDSTNWWCFTDESLKRLISRSGWDIIVYKRFGCDGNANPIDNRKDGRAFAYLKSKILKDENIGGVKYETQKDENIGGIKYETQKDENIGGIKDETPKDKDIRWIEDDTLKIYNVDNLFIIPDRSMPLNCVHIGISSIAAYIYSKGYNSRALNTSLFADEDIKEILKSGYNYIFVTMIDGQTDDIYHLARLVKSVSPNTKIVVGGPHITVTGTKELEMCEHIDYLVVGEGEDTVLELLQNKPVAHIKGLIFRNEGEIVINEHREFIENLNMYPSPKRDIYLRTNWSEHPIVTSRGCLYGCSFCCSAKIWNHNCRFLSVTKVEDDIKSIVRIVKKNEIIVISDDFFNFDKTRTIELCEMFKKYQIKYFARGLRADKVDDNVAKALKDSGCVGVGIGIESFDNSALKMMRKHLTTEQIEEGCNCLIRYDIPISGQFIIGNIGDTLESVKKSIEFAKILHNPSFYPIYVLPQTHLEKYVKEKNLLFKEPYVVTGLKGKKKTAHIFFETDIFPLEDRIDAILLADSYGYLS